MWCQFLLYSQINRPHMNPLPYGLPSHSAHHKAFSRVLRALQYVLISYLSYQSLCVHPNPPLPPWYPYICSLRLCFYFRSASRSIHTVFLRCTYICIYGIRFSLSDFTLCDTLQPQPCLCKGHYILIEAQLIYTVILVSDAQQSESVMCRHKFTLLPILFLHRSLQNTEQRSLCYTVDSHLFSILYTEVCICQSQTSDLPLPHPLTPW